MVDAGSWVLTDKGAGNAVVLTVSSGKLTADDADMSA